MTQTWVTVQVPATSANLGPGYDCLGLALELRDTYRARISDTPGVRVTISGEGADHLPTDGTNLVAASVLRAFEHFGEATPTGLEIDCTNVIPHGKGLGSSSAAIVGGLALARGLSERGDELSSYALLEFATELEGHPDNVAPAIYGGFTLTWVERGIGRAVSLQPHAAITPIVAVADSQLSTSTARGLMPTEIPLAEAVFNAGRAALLGHAITQDPELLLPATADKVHQDRRATAYEQSHKLVTHLRERGLAAVISGAGPSVLILSIGNIDDDLFSIRKLAGSSYQVTPLQFAAEGVRYL